MIADKTKIYLFNDFITFFKGEGGKVSDFFRKNVGQHWSMIPMLSGETTPTYILIHPKYPGTPLSTNASWIFGEPVKKNDETLEFIQSVKYAPNSQDPEVATWMKKPITVRHVVQHNVISGLEDTTQEQALRYFLDGQNAELVGQIIKLGPAISFLDMNFSYRRPYSVYALPSYNFYVPKYEELIQKPIFPEEVLPNMYVFSLITDGGNKDYIINQSDFDSTTLYGDTSAFNGTVENLRKFDQYITLDGNISLLQAISPLGFVDGLILGSYLETYRDAFDNVSIDYIETWKTKFGSFFNDLTEADKFNRIYNTRYQFPMFIDLEFSVPDKFCEFLEAIRAYGLVPKLFQDVILDRLKSAVEPTSEQLKNYYKIDLDGPVNMEAKDYYTFDLTQWYDNFTIDEPAVVDETVEPVGITTITGDTTAQVAGGVPAPNYTNEAIFLDYNATLDVQNDPFLNDVLRFLSKSEIMSLKEKNFRTYEQIINGELAKSDMIGFRITKSDALGNKIQEFWMPNISGMEMLNYVDTQVKYGKNYKYDIKAYHLVYGTEYKYISKAELPDESITNIIIDWSRERALAAISKVSIVTAEQSVVASLAVSKAQAVAEAQASVVVAATRSGKKGIF